MTRVALPFVRPPREVVAADAWMVTHGGELYELPGHLDSWDYNTVLQLNRDVRIGVDAIREASGLGADSRLALVVASFATATWCRERLFYRVLTQNEEQLRLEVEIGGGELGGTLELRTAVVLDAGDGNAGSSFTAHLPASVVWEDRHRVRLQGDAPLFPISVVNFERAGFSPHAPWHLAIGTDLALPLHAAIRLYLNADSASVVAAFSSAASPTDEQRAILRAAYADVARLMVEHALNQEALHDSAVVWDVDSLGFALSALMHRYFPGADLSALRLRRVDHPTDFGTELLSKLRPFDD
jgi:hypothetical protein